MMLVASGAASRVTLCGLRFGERLLPESIAVAQHLGVEVVLDRGVQGSTAVVVTARS
jgi:hypothetical protein